MDLKIHRAKFDKIIEHYQTDVSSIRTGRASGSMLDEITVEAYDGKFQIKELATITVPEPRTILIQPWDKASQEPIIGAIKNSGVGLNPIADGQGIRLNLPPLTEERRHEFIKLLKHKTEEARITIRRARGEIWEDAQEQEKAGTMREKEKFKIKEGLQKLVDEYNGKVEELEKKKEQELLTS